VLAHLPEMKLRRDPKKTISPIMLMARRKNLHGWPAILSLILDSESGAKIREPAVFTFIEEIW
jgi:hypothetical protein